MQGGIFHSYMTCDIVT